MADRSLIRSLDLTDAVERELALRNRLLPQRWDMLALVPHHEAVEAALRPLIRRGASGVEADVVLCYKGWRGVRPLHVMTIRDRVLYRALVEHISIALPEALRARATIAEFHAAPLDVDGVTHVSKADVAAYYEFVDHQLLTDELIAQTGEQPAVDLLMELLEGVMGRKVGLPQVHTASDVLGDTYIDPVRRRMIRTGHPTFAYSDDFRIASTSLGEARAALEACAREVRALGLVLNERKTLTYGQRKYRKSLTSFADAERELFEGESQDEDGLGFLEAKYPDPDEPITTFGATPLDQGIDEEEVIDDAELDVSDLDPRRVSAAERAWDLWMEEDESDETQAGLDAAITQSLLGRALPTLGAAGNEAPIQYLDDLLRYEPALAPQTSEYITKYAASGPAARTQIRAMLDDIVRKDIQSPWQAMWFAQAAGGVRRGRTTHAYEEWLVRQVGESRHDGVAATAAATLGRLGRGDPAVVAAALNRVGPAWRTLVFWGLIGLDRRMAEEIADDKVDRLLLEATEL